MKIGFGIVFALAVFAWFMLASPTVSVIQSTTQTHVMPDESNLPMTNSADNAKGTAGTSGIHNENQVNTSPAEKSHLDHLSPEMKQAIKDKLFHHGPKHITKDSQGRIHMDHAGRYVNMPVAVRKDDGTIEIKEYSVISDTKTDTAQ